MPALWSLDDLEEAGLSAWDPEALECRGHYGYGAGFHEREGRVAARYLRQPVYDYCARCPIRPECWNETLERVREGRPEEMRAADAAARVMAVVGGSGPALLACRARVGLPVPQYDTFVENMELGRLDRDDVDDPWEEERVA